MQHSSRLQTLGYLRQDMAKVRLDSERIKLAPIAQFQRARLADAVFSSYTTNHASTFPRFITPFNSDAPITTYQCCCPLIFSSSELNTAALHVLRLPCLTYQYLLTQPNPHFTNLLSFCLRVVSSADPTSTCRQQLSFDLTHEVFSRQNRLRLHPGSLLRHVRSSTGPGALHPQALRQISLSSVMSSSEDDLPLLRGRRPRSNVDAGEFLLHTRLCTRFAIQGLGRLPYIMVLLLPRRWKSSQPRAIR